MKLSLTRTSKCATVIAALAMAATGAMALNQDKADAATVATVNSGVTARLYTDKGSLISNRALAPNTPWLVGKIQTINGQTMYQVATNEYLKASDSTIKDTNASAQTKLAGKVEGGDLTLYNSRAHAMSNRSLANGTAWLIGKHIVNKLGQHFVQVSTYEYADATKMAFNMPVPAATYDADFAVDPSEDNSNSSSNSNNSSNSSSNQTTTPSTGTDENNTNTSTNQSSTPDLAAVQSAVVSAVNSERQSKGLNALTVDSKLTQAAAIRVKEADTLSGHTRPNGQPWYTSYSEVGIPNPDGLYSGEDIFGTPWNQLSVKTPQHYAYVMMDNFRGETAEVNHYKELMKPVFTKIGVGTYYNASTDEVTVTLEFTN